MFLIVAEDRALRQSGYRDVQLTTRTVTSRPFERTVTGWPSISMSKWT